MELDYDKILKRANDLCLKMNADEGRIDLDKLGYMAPEQFPKIRSTQVKSMLKALIEALTGVAPSEAEDGE